MWRALLFQRGYVAAAFLNGLGEGVGNYYGSCARKGGIRRRGSHIVKAANVGAKRIATVFADETKWRLDMSASVTRTAALSREKLASFVVSIRVEIPANPFAKSQMLSPIDGSRVFPSPDRGGDLGRVRAISPPFAGRSPSFGAKCARLGRSIIGRTGVGQSIFFFSGPLIIRSRGDPADGRIAPSRLPDDRVLGSRSDRRIASLRTTDRVRRVGVWALSTIRRPRCIWLGANTRPMARHAR